MKTYAISEPPHLSGGDSLLKRNGRALLALAVPVAVLLIFSPILTAEIAGLSLAVSFVCCLFFSRFSRDAFFRGTWLLNGLLLALMLPVNWPLEKIAAGAALLFLTEAVLGGYSRRFFHPVPAVLALLYVFSPFRWVQTAMTSFSVSAVDFWHQSRFDHLADLSSAAVLAAGILWTKTENRRFEIPWIFIASVFLPLFFFGGPWQTAGFQKALFLYAFFILTDFASTPQNPKAHRWMVFGAGILSAFVLLIRPETDLCFPVLAANALTPLLDQTLKPRRVG